MTKPLSDIQLEVALLGLLVVYPARLGSVRLVLPDAEAFSQPGHQALYRALQIVAERGATPDRPALREALIGLPGADTVDEEFLTYVVDEASLLESNAVPHAKTIRELWLRRQVVARIEAAVASIHDRAAPLRETIASTVGALVTTGTGLIKPQLTMAQGMWVVMEDLERQSVLGPVVGVTTRLEQLDAITHGWQAGQLVIVGARPAVGKTSFALDCALEAANDGAVVVISLEMPAHQIRRRLLARESGVNLWHIRDPESWARYLKRLTPASQQLSELPIRIVDAGNTPAEVRLIVEQYTSECRDKIKLVIVDTSS